MARPMPDGQSIVHRLQHQPPGQFFPPPPPLQNVANVQRTHSADTQAIHLAHAQRFQAVPQSQVHRRSSQRPAGHLKGSGVLFHRNHQVQASCQPEGQLPVVAADIGMARAANPIGDGL